MHASYPGYPRGKGAPREVEFISWLRETTTSADISPEERHRRLLEWEKDAPFARLTHPREEHLLPLHVVSGCTGFTPGRVIFDDFVMGGMSLACLGYWCPGSEKSGGESCEVDGGGVPSA